MSQPLLAAGSPVTFLIGGLGAGKTELALNLAQWHRRRRGAGQVHLLDLDVVNPFFRVRKLRDELRTQGINVVAPIERVAASDIPALNPAIWGSLDTPDTAVIVDVGGGELGLRPLARVKDLAVKREANVLFVLNPLRPGFLTPDDMDRNLRKMTEISALSVTHLVANPHLTGETDRDIFLDGVARVQSCADRLGIAFGFAMCAASLIPELKADVIRAYPDEAGDDPCFVRCGQTETFIISRFWDTPWIIEDPQRASLGPVPRV